MNRNQPTIAYGLYARKSSEQEDRQVASIDSQKRELDALVQRDGLSVRKIFEESHSAKRPGRPVFNELVAAIERGRINALLTWSPNRISRNAIDTGVIIDLMDRDKLLEIRTPSQTYYNTPNDKFLLGLFCGQAKLENDNKGVDVKRGLKAKAERGIYPAPAPLGYLNDRYAERGNKTIVPDPDRFDLVRKMFDLMLTGDYTPPQILAIANEEWGFRTPLGNKMSRSNIYNIFSRPFYSGRFEYPVGSGNWYTGAHKPMITKAEYRHIQSLMQISACPKPRRGELAFPYRGPLRCGACKAMITAERKTKRQQNGNVHEYVYYHCTKRKDPSCRQPSLREEALEGQIEKLLAAIEIPEHVRRWGLEYIESLSGKSAADRKLVADTIQKTLERCERKLGALIDLRVNGELTEAEFSATKEKLTGEADDLRFRLEQLDSGQENDEDAADRLLSFAQNARAQFIAGDPETRKEITLALGSNLLIQDKKLVVERSIWIDALRRVAKEVRAIEGRFEPPKTRMTQHYYSKMYMANPRMLRALDDVRTAAGRHAGLRSV